MQAASPTSGSADAAGWTLTFRDGQRRIDMVLAYPDESEIGPDAIKRQTYRKTFENNLFKQGLQLEVEPSAVGEPEQKMLWFQISLNLQSYQILLQSRILGTRKLTSSKYQRRGLL